MRALPEIPAFEHGAAVVDRALEAARVPERVSVSEAALRHRVLHNPGGGYSGAWQFDRVPYLRRPMDALGADSPYAIVALVGPAQSGKSEVGNCWLMQSAIYDPADTITIGPDKEIMRSYIVSAINGMIRSTPELRERLLLHAHQADTGNIFSKVFRGGVWWFAWPVAAQLRARPIPRARVDDFDSDSLQDIQGEGDVLTLLAGRQSTFEGHEKTYVNSSPALGEKAGIEALVARGTDERWTWQCPSCGEWWAPDFERDLRFDRSGDEALARETAHVVCPASGCVLSHGDKPALHATGQWLGVGQTITPEGEVVGELPARSIASFRVDGLMGFSSWGRLAELWRAGEIALADRQDEAPLRAFWNTRGGKNYTSAADQAEAIDADTLKARRGGYNLGEVPAGVQVLTAAVDVQGDRFEVEVMGWGEGLESWIVDRFALAQLEVGGARVDPAGHPEHWSVLLRYVMWRRYPVQDAPEFSLPILNTAIDTGGAEGVSENASTFWYTARRAGVPSSQITLVKGGNDRAGRLIPSPTWLELDGRGRPKKGGPVLFVLNVHRLKDIVAARLRRADPGPGFKHFPADLPAEYYEELVAEEKQGGKWVKVRARNETLDLEVYNAAALIRHAGERSDLAWVPAPFRPTRTLPAAPAEVAPPAATDLAGTPQTGADQAAEAPAAPAPEEHTPAAAPAPFDGPPMPPAAAPPILCPRRRRRGNRGGVRL